MYLERIHYVKHIDTEAFEEFPFNKNRSDLNLYGNLVRGVLGRGLEQWKEAGILEKLTNGALLLEAANNLADQEMPIDQDLLTRLLDDSKYLFNFIRLSQRYNNLCKFFLLCLLTAKLLISE